MSVVDSISWLHPLPIKLFISSKPPREWLWCACYRQCCCIPWLLTVRTSLENWRDKLFISYKPEDYYFDVHVANSVLSLDQGRAANDTSVYVLIIIFRPACLTRARSRRHIPLRIACHITRKETWRWEEAYKQLAEEGCCGGAVLSWQIRVLIRESPLPCKIACPHFGQLNTG